MKHTNDINGHAEAVNLGGNGDALLGDTLQEANIATIGVALGNRQGLGFNLVSQRATHIDSIDIGKNTKSGRVSTGHNTKQSLGEDSIIDALKSGVVKSVQNMASLSNLGDTSLIATVSKNSLANVVALLGISGRVHRELANKAGHAILPVHSGKANFNSLANNSGSVSIRRNASEITQFLKVIIHYQYPPFKL